MKLLDISNPEGQLGAQISFEEALKLRKKELEGAESKLRDDKERNKRPREPREVPKKHERHDPFALSRDYEIPRSAQEPRNNSQKESSWGASCEPKRSPEMPKIFPQKLRRIKKMI